MPPLASAPAVSSFLESPSRCVSREIYREEICVPADLQRETRVFSGDFEIAVGHRQNETGDLTGEKQGILNEITGKSCSRTGIVRALHRI